MKGGRKNAAKDAGGDRIAYVFEWYLGGTHVAVYGDFNGW
jgi:hypothetical protein